MEGTQLHFEGGLDLVEDMDKVSESFTYYVTLIVNVGNFPSLGRNDRERKEEEVGMIDS